MRRLRDFAGIAVFFSDREIDELQATVDARREARAARPDDPPRGGGVAARSEARRARFGPPPRSRGVTAGAAPRVQHCKDTPTTEEVAMDKAEGKMKEAYGALVGDEAKKAEGRALQRKAKAVEEAEQRETTRQAEAEAKKAEKERDRQKGKGGLLGDTLPKL